MLLAVDRAPRRDTEGRRLRMHNSRSQARANHDRPRDQREPLNEAELLGSLTGGIRRAVARAHRRAPFVSDDELRRELVADILEVAQSCGRRAAANQVLAVARRQLMAWAVAE